MRRIIDQRPSWRFVFGAAGVAFLAFVAAMTFATKAEAHDCRVFVDKPSFYGDGAGGDVAYGRGGITCPGPEPDLEARVTLLHGGVPIAERTFYDTNDDYLVGGVEARGFGAFPPGDTWCTYVWVTASHGDLISDDLRAQECASKP